MAAVMLVLFSLLVSVHAQDLFLAPSSIEAQRGPWGLNDESPLDTYLKKADPNYKWFDTQHRVKMLSGATGYVLNVTSQQWLDTSKAIGPNGAIWTHQVLVIVPKTVKVVDHAMIYITGNCNENPGWPKATDEEPLVMDRVLSETGSIGVVLYQIPNCHIVYPSDPTQAKRSEDAMIAWAWNQYLKTRDPEWLPRLPMAKAAMQAMRAVQEFTSQQKMAEIDGWLVSGASKRGWTTWMVGAANCPSCPKIKAIAPIVPIVPNLKVNVHHMWRAFGGLSFAFSDYVDANITRFFDDPGFADMMQIVDPVNYLERLARLPKFVLVSSDDEFMMFEWTKSWWDMFTGEKHLMIANNAEHSMATGILELLGSLGNFANSIFRNGTRPEFSWDLDLQNGVITVKIPEHVKHGKVVLRTAPTLNLKRRDFRWFVKADNKNGTAKCNFPDVGPLKLLGFEACVQPTIWTGKTLEASSPGVYEAKLKKPLLGWTGAYVEVFFPSDSGLKSEYQFTTAGMVWPQTLPYPDCHGAECGGSVV
jgi:PhoPQ-activated pathogenicity-related protein